MDVYQLALMTVLQAVETKKVKMGHEGVHRNSEDYYKEMKMVVKGTDTIPFGVSRDLKM